MSYSTDIDFTNVAKDDLDRIKDNFSLLEDAQIVEHNLDVSDPDNGYYVRWENGLQICFGDNTIANFAIDESEGNFYRNISADSTTDLPVSFVNENFTPLVFLGRDRATFTETIGVTHTLVQSNSEFRFYVKDDVSSTIDLEYSWVAIGRWK